MVHIPEAQYPHDLPDGCYHYDTDDADRYRLPRNLQDDYIVALNADTPPAWRAATAVGQAPIVMSEAMQTRGMILLARRDNLRVSAENAQLRAEVQHLQANPPPAPAPAQGQGPVINMPPRRDTVRLPNPDKFTGVPNEKGVYQPEPRDFKRALLHYMEAQEEEFGYALTEARKIVIASTFLDRNAGMWYDQ